MSFAQFPTDKFDFNTPSKTEMVTKQLANTASNNSNLARFATFVVLYKSSKYSCDEMLMMMMMMMMMMMIIIITMAIPK
eukprot:6147876-Amphidinium_carterae.1